jgi:hypothetical protein
MFARIVIERSIFGEILRVVKSYVRVIHEEVNYGKVSNGYKKYTRQDQRPVRRLELLYFAKHM